MPQGGSFEQRTTKTLVEIKKEEGGQSSQKILSFIDGKIPAHDLEIIRCALYIRNKKDRQHLGRLKYDVIVRYGRRGNTIVNLCSQGYFEEFFIPFYEILKAECTNVQEANEKFLAFFNNVVNELPFTIFVNHKMDTNQLKEEILAKRKYGLKFLNIHGIGQANINTIERCIAVIETDIEISGKTTDKKTGSISISLKF